MGSSDPILTLLKDFSYSVVRLPRANIRPLQVLEKQGNDLTLLGDLSDLFQQGSAALPAVGPDEQAAFINGKRSRNLDISVGLNLLGGIIGAMTGTKLSLTAGYKNASNLSFQFDDVKMNQINQLALNRFLAGARIAGSFGSSILEALENDRLYVITTTIKSNKFTTDASRSDGTSVSVDVPVIQQVVGGTVGVQTSGSSNSTVTYTGTAPLIFGFQAAAMRFSNGVFVGLKQAKPDAIAIRGARPKPEFEMLSVDAPFANLKDDSGRLRASGGGEEAPKTAPAKGGGKKGGAKKAGAKKGGAKKAAGKAPSMKAGAKKGAAKTGGAKTGGAKKGGAKKGAAKKGGAKAAAGKGAGARTGAKNVTFRGGAKTGGAKKGGAKKAAGKASSKKSAKTPSKARRG